MSAPATSRPRLVGVALIRRAYLERVESDGLTAREFALWLGWFDKHGEPNVRRVQERLGLAPGNYGRRNRRNGKARCGQRVSYEIAVELVRALDLDPHEVPGL